MEPWSILCKCMVQFCLLGAMLNGASLEHNSYIAYENISCTNALLVWRLLYLFFILSKFERIWYYTKQNVLFVLLLFLY